MWQLLNSNAAAVQALSAVIVGLLTIVLAWATLRYVRLTGQIAKSSTAQAEALHKPVLTFKRDDHISESELGDLVRDAVLGQPTTMLVRSWK